MLLLGLANGCSSGAPKEEPAGSAGLQAECVKCVNGDLGARSRMYNSITLDAAEVDFAEHFKVRVGTDDKDVQGTTVALDLDKFLALRSTLGKSVAIMVNYGLNGDAFFPVFEFLELDSASSSVKAMDKYYVVDGDSLLQAVAPAHNPEALMKAYRKNIRIKRTEESNDLDSVRTIGTSYPDPLAEWFQFDLELNRLIADNPSTGKRTLVLTCISELVCYSATTGFIAADAEQFRHMIAWYVAADGQPELGAADLSAYRPNGDIYHKRAVDLGHLCPPRCK